MVVLLHRRNMKPLQQFYFNMQMLLFPAMEEEIGEMCRLSSITHTFSKKGCIYFYKRRIRAFSLSSPSTLYFGSLFWACCQKQRFFPVNAQASRGEGGLCVYLVQNDHPPERKTCRISLRTNAMCWPNA